MFQFSYFWECDLSLNRMKSKQIGVGMSTNAYKTCNWHLSSFHYFTTSNAKNKKDSNNKITLICVSWVTSRIKGHYVYNYKYKVGETLICDRESANKYSQNEIAAKSKDQEVTGHIPEALAYKLFTSLREWKIYNVCETIPSQKRSESYRRDLGIWWRYWNSLQIIPFWTNYS